MKKIDILNFITNFRKSPNEIKTYGELLTYVGSANEPVLKQFLTELQHVRAVREIEKQGEKAYQVIGR